ncbi:MAG: N-acetylmuramoyl-L-alanine amidase [Puniceicoccales bacterium]|jgi:N-acetylmuramoyl-L-alanine amidase|nr:N-acetylmuramoyl-L-alanine amidase [Puniceicoccales bacterium]
MGRLGLFFRCAFVFASLFLSSGLFAAPGDYLGLDVLSDRCGGAVSYGEGGRCGTVRGKNLELQCRLNGACYRLNGVNVYGQCAVAGQPGRLRIGRSDWDLLIVPLLSPPAIVPPRRVCVDPGHGGRDMGAGRARGNLEEKNLTLDVAKRLEVLLKRQGVEVLLTRSGDQFVALEDRSAIANNGKCDLMVCIHFNAADSPRAEGIETYILPSQGSSSTARLHSPSAKDKKFCVNNRHDEKNLYLAYCLQKELKGLRSAVDRGVKRGRFKVLENADCPAVLVECGFLTASGEGARIADGNYRQAIANALCEGICSYGGRKK